MISDGESTVQGLGGLRDLASISRMGMTCCCYSMAIV